MQILFSSPEMQLYIYRLHPKKVETSQPSGTGCQSRQQTLESHNTCVMACFLSDSPCSRETAGPTAKAFYPRYNDRGP